MGTGLDEELNELRARAYGPNADLVADPVALRRLAELEDGARAARATPVPPVPSAPADAPEVSDSRGTPEPHSSTPVGPHPASGSTATEPAPPGPPPAVRTRRLILACAVTAVVAALVGAAVTSWALSLGERPYAVLHPVDGPANDLFFSPESDAQRYDDFAGMRVTTGTLGAQQGRCILIELEPDEATGYDSGSTRGACSAPGFDAVADISLIDQIVPIEVRERLGDIVSLRFEVSGDDVHVFVFRSPSDSTES